MDMNNIQLHTLYRLHPSYMITEGVSAIKGLIFPLILLWFVNANSDSTFSTIGKWGLLGLVFVFLGLTVLYWINYRYEFHENEMRIIKGGLTKKEQSISYKHIQNVSKSTNFVGKWFGVTSLKFETEAHENSTVDLKMIKLDQAEQIQDFIASRGSRFEEQEETSEEMTQKQLHYQVTNKELLIASMTSFSFLTLIPIVLGIFFNIDELFSLDGFVDTVWTFLKEQIVWMVVGMIVFLLISLVFGLIVTFLRFGKFEVSSDEERIYIKKGMLNTKEYSILRSKVQGVRVSQSIIRRMFGLVKVNLVCATGGLGEDGEESTMIFPFLAQARLHALLQEIIPAYAYTPPKSRLPHEAKWVRLLTPSYLWLFGSLLIWFIWSHLWYLSPILLALILAVRLLDYKYTRYELNKEVTQAYSGGLYVEGTTTNMVKVDEVRIERSWLQRRWGLATLRIETRSSQGTTLIKDLPYVQADEYYQWYAELTNDKYYSLLQKRNVLEDQTTY